MIDIAERVRQVIPLHLGAVETGMAEDPKLVDLGADSLDVNEVVTSLEEKFNIHITDHDTACFVTVGDAIAFIRSKVG
jgi:acyl carrier protein